MIPPGVLNPPSDSLLLAEQLRQHPIWADTRVLDLCSGSGILAIVAARRGARHVTAVDISRRAVFATRLNARLNRVRIKALHGDLFAAVPGIRFDLIVSNPPYLPSAVDIPERGAARAWEAGPRGRSFLDRICSEASAHLVPGGVLLLVHSSLSDEQETVRALSERGFEAEVIVRERGPLGPRMKARAAMLRARGLLAEGGEFEEIVVVRGRRQNA